LPGGGGFHHLIFLWARLRIKIAAPFMLRVITISTSPAAAALAWNSSPGRDTQLNIWIGRALNGENSHSADKNGGAEVIAAGGKNAMKVSAPIVIRGALSPIARDIAKITPVAIPPVE
jgi:hypothetical protein